MLFARERPNDVDRYRDVRVDAQLLKPVFECELVLSIQAVLNRTDAEPRGADAPSAIPIAERTPPGGVVASLRVLVAEDNEFNSQLMQQLLTRRGHHVEIATTGHQTLRLIEAGGHDLLLLDIHMPELDGFQVIRAIRERERETGGYLPVIAVTARSRKEDKERCVAAGMDDCLAKPISAAELWATIDRVVAASAAVGGRIARKLP